MRQKILIALSILLMLGYGITLTGKTAPEDYFQEVYQEEMAAIAGGTVTYDCQLFENADYYMRFVYLWAGQDNMAGSVKFRVERRDGQYLRLRVEFLTNWCGWEILESHLYVGTEPPKKMAPGLFPYQQETPSGLTKHLYYIDLEDIGSGFEIVYMAAHAVVRKVTDKFGCSSDIPIGQEETAWGFKTLPNFYPVIEPGNIWNPDGNPWGTIFPKPKKRWPAYFMIYIPYNVAAPWFECPQPLDAIVYF